MAGERSGSLEEALGQQWLGVRYTDVTQQAGYPKAAPASVSAQVGGHWRSIDLGEQSLTLRVPGRGRGSLQGMSVGEGLGSTPGIVYLM